MVEGMCQVGEGLEQRVRWCEGKEKIKLRRMMRYDKMMINDVIRGENDMRYNRIS